MRVEATGFSERAMSASPYTASCLCGGVQLALKAEPGPIQICHCVMCRKAQGGPFAAHAEMPASALDVTAGAELLANYESSPGVHRMFCKRCGSPLFSTNADNPSVVRIRVGLIDGPLRTRPSAHYYVGQMANWWRIDDALLRFETE
jgi:hypothetical protein